MGRGSRRQNFYYNANGDKIYLAPGQKNPFASGSDFGAGEVGGDRNWSAPVHGTTADGQDVTAAFKGEETMLADGHRQNPADFYGPDGTERHDHYGDGRNDNGTERGEYTGHGS